MIYDTVNVRIVQASFFLYGDMQIGYTLLTRNPGCY